MPAPAAISTALMIGETFSSCVVSMPIEEPPTLTPECSVCGMGTTSEAIPRTTNITPAQNSNLTVFSFCRRVPAQEIVSLEQLGQLPATLGFRCIALHNKTNLTTDDADLKIQNGY